MDSKQKSASWFFNFNLNCGIYFFNLAFLNIKVNPIALSFKNISLLFSLFYVFLLSFDIKAQEPFVRKISYREGLPTQVIYDLYVSKEGMMYLGTDQGLLSFDGVRFKHHNSERPNGIAVNSIQEGADGKIWFKNFVNELFFLENGVVKQYKPLKDLLGYLDQNMVNFLVVNDKVYVITEQFLYSFTKDGQAEQLYEASSEDILHALSFNDVKLQIVLASKFKLVFFKDGYQVSSYQVVKGQKEVLCLQDKIYYLIKGFENNLFVFDTVVSELHTSKSLGIYNILSSHSDNVWLSTSNGVYLIDIVQQKISDGFLQGKNITDFTIDQEGNKWISSIDEGLFMIPNFAIKLIQSTLVSKERSTNYSKIAISPDGLIYVGTKDGKIVSYSTDYEELMVYDSESAMEIEFLFFYNDYLYCSLGVFKIGNPKILYKSYLGKDLAVDDHNNILMASYNMAGLISHDLKNSPNMYSNLAPNSKLLVNDYEIPIFIFRNKRARSVFFCPHTSSYYIGYADGLFVYDYKGNFHELRMPSGYNILANDMYVDADQTLWIATSQEGLIAFRNNKFVAQFSKKQGLSNNNCIAIKVVKRGVWILTSNGLDYLDINTSVIKRITLNLSLKGVKINDFAISDSDICLATTTGIIKIPIAVSQLETLPNFKVENIFVNGVHHTSMSSDLKYNQNNITFTFKTIFFKSLGDYSFQYRLLGFDDRWQEQSSLLNKVNFIALRPGAYTFEARVVVGNSYSQTERIYFSIHKSFWQQTWFLILLILLLLVGVYFVYKWAEIRTHNKQKIKESLALSQLTALRLQMNPHFVFNVLHAVQGLIYSNQKTKANEYLVAFSDLMRKTLDVSEKKEISICEEVNMIEMYVGLEKGRFEANDFEFKIVLPDEDLSQYAIPSLIIQPFVENAIKHGLMHKQGHKKLIFEISKVKGEYWKILIRDNGIGRVASNRINLKTKKYQSFATHAIQHRISLINKLISKPIFVDIKDLDSDDYKNSGTEVSIMIPIKKII